jgi:hypothetical protein
MLPGGWTGSSFGLGERLGCGAESGRVAGWRLRLRPTHRGETAMNGARSLWLGWVGHPPVDELAVSVRRGGTWWGLRGGGGGRA